ncbi:MAG: hypothetical protein AB7G23_03025 [Vicinamibacterales bacterium]
MSTPHVPVSPALRLPASFAQVPGYLARMDPDLRLRRSAERPDLYVLERRCRRRPVVNTGMRDVSDMHVQARDGYIHVATVHPNWLTKPWNIIRALREEGTDLWARGGAARVADELDYEEQWARETRRRRRLGLFRDIAADAYPVLDRMGNRDGTDRTRINNAGTTAA